jgi:hypothetical protein
MTHEIQKIPQKHGRTLCPEKIISEVKLSSG